MTTKGPSNKAIEQARGVMETHILRLHPGQEIKSTLEEYVLNNGLKSAFIMTAVGSVTKATLRFAYRPDPAASKTERIQTINQHMEIVSLVGTLNDGSHLHISLSDKEGTVIGGHVMGDLIVFTTCEVALGNCPAIEVYRPFDASTGFPELAVRQA